MKQVQRLFAASPGLLLESELYVGKSSIQVLPAKMLPSENVLEAPPSIVKPKYDLKKPNPISECTTENANIKLKTQQSKYKPASATASDAKPPPWFFPPPPPGNQWLVPVMSPSEGLVYKPYAGPCPPTSCLMLPFYGGDFSNTHRQRIGNYGHAYFPPYGMPPMNLSVSSSAVEQVSLFATSCCLTTLSGKQFRKQMKIPFSASSDIAYSGITFWIFLETSKKAFFCFLRFCVFGKRLPLFENENSCQMRFCSSVFSFFENRNRKSKNKNATQLNF